MIIQRVDSTASTSLALRELIERDPPQGAIVLVATTQTGGIGQFGRRWQSPRGGLWFTAALPLAHAPGSRALSDFVSGDPDRPPLGTRLGTLCRDALASTLPSTAPAITVTLKPPNDLLLASRIHPGGAKVAGILTEIVSSIAPPRAWVLVGIGINSNVPAEQIPRDLPYPATSLLAELGVPVDNETLLLAMLAAIRAATA